MAKHKKQLVKIEWSDPEDDWPWFYLLKDKGKYLYLQGADCQDGTGNHAGDKFFARKSEIVSMKKVGRKIPAK